MKQNTKDIVLSVSAVTAALSTLAQVAPLPGNTEGHKIQVTHSETMYQGAIDEIMNNNAVQMKLRMSMNQILPGMEVDKDTMEETWLRLANANINTDTLTGILEEDRVIIEGTLQGIGKLVGPQQDATLDDRISTATGVQGCYSNCHAACHGSRGWR